MKPNKYLIKYIIRNLSQTIKKEGHITVVEMHLPLALAYNRVVKAIRVSKDEYIEISCIFRV